MALRGYRYQIRGRHKAILLCCLLASASARGQSLDYDRLEILFDEPVTMSATGKPERLSDTPATMDIITQDDIKRSGARDLKTLLRLLPGVISYGGYNGTEAFSMGAILLNGREIYLGVFGETLLGSIPVELEEIRQIEVVRGPQSALYGFNSGDGVINIITFDPAGDAVNYARLRGGNDARRDGAASLTLNPLDGVGLRLTAADDHQHDTGFTMARGMTIPADNPERRSFSADLSAYLPNGDHTSLEVAHTDLSQRVSIPETTLLLNLRMQNDAVKGDYTADTALGRIGALLSYNSLMVPEGVTYVNGAINLHDHTIDGRINDLVKLSPDDSVRAEFEARNEAVHSGVSVEPISTLMVAGSAMWDHRFSESLSMVNALRYQVGDISQTGPRLANGDFHQTARGVADNSSLIYRMDPDNTVRASFARGLALPSQLNFVQLGLTSTSAKGTSLAAGTPIIPWSNTEERVTYDHQFRDWGATARASLFHEQTENLISLLPLQILAAAAPTCNPPTARTLPTCRSLAASSLMSGVAQGVELEIEHKSRSGPTWGVNYSVEVLKPHPNAFTDTLLPDVNEWQTVQKANAHLGYGWGDWSADLRLLYTSPFQALTLDTVSGPTSHVALLNAPSTLQLSPRLGWQATDYASIELSAENLWPYRLNALQRIDSSYFLTVKFTY